MILLAVASAASVQEPGYIGETDAAAVEQRPGGRSGLGRLLADLAGGW